MASGTWIFQMPTRGDLVALQLPFNSTVTSVTDNNSDTWTKVAPDGRNQFWYTFTGASNTPLPNLKVTIHVSTTNGNSMRVFDISNATAYDTGAAGSDVSCNSATSVSNQPSLTPGHNSALILTYMALGTGPGLSVTSPTGAVWDLVTYTNESDVDYMENADAVAHKYLASSGTTYNFNWTITSQASNDCSSVGVSFY